MDIGMILALLADPKVIAILSPIMVAGLKKLASKIPSWALPLLCAALGAALSAVTGGDVATGAGAGLMGIGAREILDQGLKARK